MFRNNFKTRAKIPLNFHYNKQKGKLLPSFYSINNFTATPTCCDTKPPHLSPDKITLTYKITYWYRGAHSSNMLYKPTGTAEHSCCILQDLLSPRQMPNPTPQPSYKFPRAVGLERISHGVIQPKMMTNFSRTLP